MRRGENGLGGLKKSRARSRHPAGGGGGCWLQRESQEEKVYLGDKWLDPGGYREIKKEGGVSSVQGGPGIRKGAARRGAGNAGGTEQRRALIKKGEEVLGALAHAGDCRGVRLPLDGDFLSTGQREIKVFGVHVGSDNRSSKKRESFHLPIWKR